MMGVGVPVCVRVGVGVSLRNTTTHTHTRSFEIKKSKIEKFSPAHYAWSYDQPHAERHQNTGSILSKKQNQEK